MGFSIKTEKILSPSNIKRIIMLGISIRDQLENTEKGLISDYDNTKTYTRGQAVYYNDYLYKCLYTTTGTWDSTKWQKIGDELDLITKQDIETMLGLTQEEIASLQSLISTEIRLDKVFSSSDTYNRLLTVENECKKFTLEQLAKKAGVVYKVVADTTGVDSTEFLYLISNGSNGYNIYAYIDNMPVKISDTNINLDGYAKLTDLSDYIKTVDADGKYATITTVDGKVDKTSILSTISSTPSDDKLLSEKAINDTLVKKTDITTTIDKNSTDTQVPSAKSVFDNIKKNGLIWQGIQELQNSQESSIFDYCKSNFISGNICGFRLKPKDVSGYFTTADVTIIYCLSSVSYGWILGISDKIGISMAIIQIDGNIGKWERLCTTSVKDVSVKDIVPADTTTFVNFAGNCNYCVKNGICCVTIWGVKITSAGASKQTGVYLPKSANGRVGAIMAGVGDGMCHAFAYILEDGQLFFDVKDANIMLYATFSYPVA